MTTNENITLTISIEEYKELLIAKTRLEFEARVSELEKLLEAERESSSYWYNRATELGKAVNEFKEKLAAYEPKEEGGDA